MKNGESERTCKVSYALFQICGRYHDICFETEEEHEKLRMWPVLGPTSEHGTPRLRKQGSFADFGVRCNQVNLNAFTEVVALATQIPHDQNTAEWFSHSFPPCTTEPFTLVAKRSKSCLKEMYVRKLWSAPSPRVQHLPRDSTYNTAYTGQELAHRVIPCFHTSTRQAMCVPRNSEDRSRKHGCLGKAMNIKHYGFVRFCLLSGKQNPPFLRRIMLSLVACLALPYFSPVSYKHHDFRKQFTGHKTCFAFPYSSVWSIFHSNKNSSQYYHTLA